MRRFFCVWRHSSAYRHSNPHIRKICDPSIRPSTIKHLRLTPRRRVECGAHVPGAGHFSRRGLQASRHSASGRAGTVIDGQKQQIVTQYPRRDHRGWSPHKTASRNEQAKPNRAPNVIFITSGEIGTHAMHPPGKRSIDINKCQNHTETRMRTQPSAHLQNL